MLSTQRVALFTPSVPPSFVFLVYRFGSGPEHFGLNGKARNHLPWPRLQTALHVISAMLIRRARDEACASGMCSGNDACLEWAREGCRRQRRGRPLPFLRIRQQRGARLTCPFDGRATAERQRVFQLHPGPSAIRGKWLSAT